jgi:Na+-transporting NADH:ubiquinone oxidoreductase subunit C
MAAGLYDESTPLDELFQNVESKIVNLESGQFVDESELDLAQFDQLAAAKDPETSVAISDDQDLAAIKRREKRSLVYLVKKDGQLDQVVLPIRGKGLWSTLYGFLALDSDMQTIRGITFYEHGETPGLGGEVDNPKWKAKWKKKRGFDDEGNIRIEVIRGEVDPKQADHVYQVDGLAGATITARGVSNLVRYWLGDHGFGPFLAKHKTT